jgi:hypothetical protein
MKNIVVVTLLGLGSTAWGCKDKPAAPATPASAAKTVPSAAGTPAPPPRPPTVPTATAVVAPKLVLAAGKIDLVRSGLKAEGNITVEGKPYAKLSADGKLSKATGEVVASIGDDGTVDFAGQTDARHVYNIDEQGKVTLDGEEAFRIDDDGSVWKRGPDGKMLNDGLNVYDGPPASRRAVALLMVGISGGGSDAPPPPPTSTRQK